MTNHEEGPEEYKYWTGEERDEPLFCNEWCYTT